MRQKEAPWIAGVANVDFVATNDASYCYKACDKGGAVTREPLPDTGPPTRTTDLRMAGEWLARHD
ncbi:hypothetical protein AB0I09_38435, partial [Streptosporangium canum]